MRTMLCLSVFGLFALTTLNLRAEDLAVVQARMKERLPQVAQMKAQKTIGEDRAGFLGLVKADAGDAAQKLVVAENADRKAVYAALAAKAGTDAARVGQQRAKELAERSAAGMMLQRDDGTWYEKK